MVGFQLIHCARANRNRCRRKLEWASWIDQFFFDGSCRMTLSTLTVGLSLNKRQRPNATACLCEVPCRERSKLSAAVDRKLEDIQPVRACFQLDRQLDHALLLQLQSRNGVEHVARKLFIRWVVLMLWCSRQL